MRVLLYIPRMCGRYSLIAEIGELAIRFEFDAASLAQAARYNSGDPRQASYLRWGLIPSGTRNTPSGSPMINARAETVAERPSFRSDLLNLTLASSAVNRSQKSGKDAAEWLPDLNRCWFANPVVEVRQRYRLTVDQRERDVLEGILSACTSTEMMVQQGRPVQTATPLPATGGGQTGDALQLYDDNGNGRITCAEVRSHGIAPVRRGHPPTRT